MKEEELHGLIVIDDSLKRNNIFINYLFSHIDEYTSGEPLERYFFWKSIRAFIELKHREIINTNRENMRLKLLSGYIYDFACHQEKLNCKY